MKRRVKVHALNPMMHVRLAEALEGCGERVAALAEYRVAGHMLLECGDPRGARAIFGIVLDRDPGDALAMRGFRIASVECERAKQPAADPTVIKDPGPPTVPEVSLPTPQYPAASASVVRTVLSDRRSAVRIPWMAMVEIYSRNVKYAGAMRDVSATGCFVAGPQIETGSVVDIHLRTPGVAWLGIGRARVVRYVGPGQPYSGVGLVLTSLDPRARKHMLEGIAAALAT